MITCTVSTKAEVLPTIRKEVEYRVKSWYSVSPLYTRSFEVRLQKGHISEQIAEISLYTKSNLWFVTGYEPLENYCAWFTTSGQFRLTKNPPKHWKGQR